MRVAVWCGHVGSDGLRPSGQFGGGELYTMAVLQILNSFYDVRAIITNGVYPNFETAPEYGYDLSGVQWSPMGDSLDWVRQYDVLINLSHFTLLPAICRRNILITFFPQQPEWDVAAYDTIIAISEFTARWVKRYWAKDAEVVYAPIPVEVISEATQAIEKRNVIMSVGRFFEVPNGNNKNHIALIDAFKRMMLPDWELHLVGSVQHKDYYERVRRAAGDDQRIHFHHDISRAEYLNLLGQARFMWSATGYKASKPSGMEHLGITAIEALAAGALPIVHNSGGMPEIGGHTWEDLVDLPEVTRMAIGLYDTTLQTSLRERASEFGFLAQGRKLLNVLEMPLLVPFNQNQFKVFVPEVKASQTKIGILSDDPTTTYGFGIVSGQMVKGFMERGFAVACLGMQNPLRGPATAYKDDPCPIWRGCVHDPMGMTLIESFLRQEKPDVLYLNYYPGNVRHVLTKLRELRVDAPLVAYLPIEGKPVVPQIIETLRLIRILNGDAVLYSRFGVEAVKEFDGPLFRYAHHGVDHAPFRQFTCEERNKLKQMVDWTGKFVVMYAGRNKRTKAFGTMLDTAELLKDSGAEAASSIVWYIHTNPEENIANSSFPLRQMVMQRGLQEVIWLAPDLDDQGHGPAYDETKQLTAYEDDPRWRDKAISTMSMIERYNLADVYCNFSEVEGFGLMPLEAAACGVPIISIDDGGVQREVLGDAAIYVPVSHWDTWHTGARIAQGNPQDYADAILALKNDNDMRAELSAAALARAEQFKWDNAVDIISGVIMERIS